MWQWLCVCVCVGCVRGLGTLPFAIAFSCAINNDTFSVCVFFCLYYFALVHLLLCVCVCEILAIESSCARCAASHLMCASGWWHRVAATTTKTARALRNITKLILWKKNKYIKCLCVWKRILGVLLRGAREEKFIRNYFNVCAHKKKTSIHSLVMRRWFIDSRCEGSQQTATTTATTSNTHMRKKDVE